MIDIDQADIFTREDLEELILEAQAGTYIADSGAPEPIDNLIAALAASSSLGDDQAAIVASIREEFANL